MSSVGTRSSLPDPPGWRRRLATAAEFTRRRLAGDFEVDEHGFDPDLNSALLMPAALALYRNWFRVQARGLGNIPDSGAALIVANHSGVLPFDAIMLQAGIFADHPAKRIGHGIGLENEPPSICAFDDTVLQAGMALTPEPKIESVDGLVNPEEQVVVRPTGCEILSRKSDWRLHIVG